MFTADAADLGHAHQDGNRRSQPDTVDAGDQVEPLGKIAVLADGCGQVLELAPLKPLETADFIAPDALNPWVPTALTAGLETSNVVGDLLDERQMLGQWRQTRIWRCMDLLDGGRAGGNQGSIDLVVLRPLQVERGIGPHLRGLEHDHHKTILAQPDHDGLLIAAAGLNPDPVDPLSPQPG